MEHSRIPFRLEFGYALVHFFDATQDGTLLRAIASLRENLLVSTGLVLPLIHLTSNMDLEPMEYVLFIKNIEVCRGKVNPDFLAVVDMGDREIERLHGDPELVWLDPIYKKRCFLIKPEVREVFENMGCLVIDPDTLILAHLMDIFQIYAPRLPDQEEIQFIASQLQKSSTAYSWRRRW